MDKKLENSGKVVHESIDSWRIYFLVVFQLSVLFPVWLFIFDLFSVSPATAVGPTGPALIRVFFIVLFDCFGFRVVGLHLSELYQIVQRAQKSL